MFFLKKNHFTVGITCECVTGTVVGFSFVHNFWLNAVQDVRKRSFRVLLRGIRERSHFILSDIVDG